MQFFNHTTTELLGNVKHSSLTSTVNVSGYLDYVCFILQNKIRFFLLYLCSDPVGVDGNQIFTLV